MTDATQTTLLLTHRQKAEAWMDSHPQAMALFREFAQQAKRAGRRIGMKAIAERVRWAHAIERNETDEYKINNSHLSWVVRRLIAEDRTLADVFETREVHA